MSSSSGKHLKLFLKPFVILEREASSDKSALEFTRGGASGVAGNPVGASATKCAPSKLSGSIEGKSFAGIKLKIDIGASNNPLIDCLKTIPILPPGG